MNNQRVPSVDPAIIYGGTKAVQSNSFELFYRNSYMISSTENAFSDQTVDKKRGGQARTGQTAAGQQAGAGQSFMWSGAAVNSVEKWDRGKDEKVARCHLTIKLFSGPGWFSSGCTIKCKNFVRLTR
jgi:hypothetical protein